MVYIKEKNIPTCELDKNKRVNTNIGNLKIIRYINHRREGVRGNLKKLF